MDVLNVETERQPLAVSGRGMSIEQLVLVARHHAPIVLADEAASAVQSCRALLEKMLARGDVIYGVNTGVGSNVKFLVDDVGELQVNLLSALSCGTGEPFPPDAIRGAMLLRVNALSRGYSGVRPVIVTRLVDLLNADIVPVVPRFGSVGASGDLIPSAYIARALMGEGTGIVHEKLRERVPFLESDRPLDRDIALASALIRERAFALP